MYGNSEIIRLTDKGYKPVSSIEDGPEWLSDLIGRAKEAPAKVLTEVVIITPSRATALLGANAHNRTISEALVNTFAADIMGGRWQFNGEPIIVSDTGELNDGQHRCQAVIAANKSIQVLVVCGVARDARLTTDMGRARTVGDFLHMHGIKDAKNIAYVASILMMFENGLAHQIDARGNRNSGSFNRHRTTKSETLRYAEDHLDEIVGALHVIGNLPYQKIGTQPRLAGVLTVLARAGGLAKAQDFIEAIIVGEGLVRGTAAYLCRERLLKEKADRTLSLLRTCEIVIRAWNAYRTGDDITRILTSGTIPAVER